MIAVTGDSRGEAGYKHISSDPLVRRMGKEDYLVILGGCGVSEPHIDLDSVISAYRDLPCSVLFLDGVYDDYDLLSEYPVFPWNGGNVQSISRGIYHLMRGQVFTLEGMRILTMGGGLSKDRPDSEKYWTWWPEQEISEKDIDEAGHNLTRAGGKVDCVFTSACPSIWAEDGDRMLDRLVGMVDYRRWYCPGLQVRDPGHKVECVTGIVIQL